MNRTWENVIIDDTDRFIGYYRGFRVSIAWNNDNTGQEADIESNDRVVETICIYSEISKLKELCCHYIDKFLI